MPEILYLLLLAALILVLGNLAWATLSGAPWVPAWSKDIKNFFNELKVIPGATIYDLGCGDDRWLLAAAKKTPAGKIVGFEISWLVYLWCRIKILFSGYPHVSVKFKNMFKSDLSQADIVLCFLLPQTILKLKPKLEKEMKPGSLFVSYAFSLPGRNPEKTFRISQKSLPIYVYRF